jgi:hypothetical protein
MKSSKAVLIVLLISLGLTKFAEASAVANSCDTSVGKRGPARPADALSGDEFARKVRTLSDDEREAAIQHELLIGNVPEFIWHLVPITLSSRGVHGHDVNITLCVAPDYLAIGSEQDFMLMPMRLGTALLVANHYGFTLPTRKLVNVIYENAQVHFTPQPLLASDAMRSTAYYWHHNELVREQRLGLGLTEDALSAGQKKDLVLTNRLWSNPDRVAIYGWHQPNGKPIQPLSTVHGWRYADYSHGVRLISTAVLVDGKPQSIFDVLENPELAGLLSDEGVIARVRELTTVFAARSLDSSLASLPVVSNTL